MVQEWKLKAVDDLAKELAENQVVGLLDLSKMPAAQLQQIRAALKGKAKIKMTKKAVIKFALAKAKKEGLEELGKIKSDEPALIISNANPFELYKTLRSIRSETFAKTGEIAQAEIIIPAGKTNLPPGPAIGDLQKAGLKAAIKGPNIEILEPKVIAKVGEMISDVAAGVLQKLGIKTIEITLNLVAAHDGKLLYDRAVLSLVEEDQVSKIANAWRAAFNVAYHANYPTKEVVEIQIGEVFREAINLAVNAQIFTKESAELLLARASAQASALKTLIG